MANTIRANQTFISKVIMYNNGTAMWHGGIDGHLHVGESGAGAAGRDPAASDGWQAGYYVIIVILVYGMSIVLLIASHINRKHRKLLEDRQIDKYLKEFQVVKERSSRDSYRNLKKAIVAKLYRGNGSGGGLADRSSNSSACVGAKSGGIYRCISKTVIPISTVAFPQALSAASFRGDDVQTVSSSGSSDALTRGITVPEACLCNLYVIEELEAEQQPTRKVPQEPSSRTMPPDSSRRKRTGSEVADHQLLRSPTMNVTAEINFPQSASSARQSGFAQQTPVDQCEDQYEVSVAVHGPFDTEETRPMAGSHWAMEAISHEQPHRNTQKYGPISVNPNPNRRAIVPKAGTSPNLRKQNLISRVQHFSSGNRGRGPSRRQKDCLMSTPYCLVDDNRSPNPLQISSV